MQRNFRGFLYISSALIIVPLILVDSYFPGPRTRESFFPTTLQFISLSDSSDTTSDISYADLGPGNGTICCLIGAWPRFRVDLAKQIPVILALWATVRGARIVVSPEVVWEGARTRFSHPGDVWGIQLVRSLTLRTSCFMHFPILRSLIYCLRATLPRGWTSRFALLPKTLLVFQC